MVEMLKKIEAKNTPLSEEDQNKINVLLKTYEDGKIEFYTSFSGLHGRNMEIKTLEEMEVLLTSDSLEKLKRLVFSSASNNLFTNALWNFFVTVGFHYILTTALCLRTKVGSVTKHITQRYACIDLLKT